MAVLTSQALHEQLSAIMGALTRAAVAEICGLLEEGYAALQGEISRKHRENENLRKKLHLIESIVVRGSGGGKAAVTPEVVPEVAPATEGDPQAETVQQQQHQQRSDRDGGAGGGVAVVREEFPDVVLIKDEDSDSNDTFEEDNKMPADGGTNRELATATRHWPESEDSDRKSSPEPLTVRAAAPQKNGVSVYALDSPRSEPDCSSQLGANNMEAGESVCSYTSQMDPDVQLVHQDCSLVPSSASRPTYFSSPLESPTNREQDLSLTWTEQSKSQMNFTQFHQNENPDNDAFGLKMVSVSGSIATDCQLSESSCSAFEYDDGCDVISFAHYRNQLGRAQICGELPGTRGRRFVCAVCTKTYATSQNLEVHMRIHTGERPFTCSQCGKKFTQSAHLKSHLSVHTGERPYTCTICSKSFIVKYSLKLHMKKYHETV